MFIILKFSINKIYYFKYHLLYYVECKKFKFVTVNLKTDCLFSLSVKEISHNSVNHEHIHSID